MGFCARTQSLTIFLYNGKYSRLELKLRQKLLYSQTWKGVVSLESVSGQHLELN